MPSTTPVAEDGQMAGQRMAAANAAIRTAAQTKAAQTKAAEERAKKARYAALKGERELRTCRTSLTFRPLTFFNRHLPITTIRSTSTTKLLRPHSSPSPIVFLLSIGFYYGLVSHDQLASNYSLTNPMASTFVSPSQYLAFGRPQSATSRSSKQTLLLFLSTISFFRTKLCRTRASTASSQDL